MVWSEKARKAAALARKRKGRFKAGRAKVKSVRKSKKAYAKKNYKGPGSIARRSDDIKNSKGNYSTNRKGKKVGKVRKKYRKANYAGNQYNATYQVSKYRGKRAARKKKR